MLEIIDYMIKRKIQYKHFFQALMMRIQKGEFLLSSNGKYYRVVECRENVISLMRVNGYTIFACHRALLESSFQPVEMVEMA